MLKVSWLHSDSGYRRTSLTRGVAWAIPLGLCGFCVPFAVLGVPVLIRVIFTDMQPFDRDAEFSELFHNAIGSAYLLSLMFAASAVANFSPRQGIGFVRSLLVTLCLLFIILIVSTAAAAILAPYLIGTYSGLRSPLLAAFSVIEIATFLVGVVVFTHWQIRRSESERNK